MKVLNKRKAKPENEVTDFEKLYINPQEAVNPVIRMGSIVLYAIVIVAVLACMIMAVLDKTGVAPSPQSQPSHKTEVTDEVDVSGHPESLQKLYRENFETADFVASYFKLKDKNKDVSLKQYKKTEGVPLFLQWDKQWGYKQFGGDFAAVTADAPMWVAMVGYYLTRDEKFSPDKVMSFVEENNYYVNGKGALVKLMTDGVAQLGLKSVQITPSNENIIASLQQGYPLICYMGPGVLTSKAHYVVIRAYGDGYLLINDPNSIVNSEKQWLFTDIASQIKGIWSISVQ